MLLALSDEPLFVHARDTDIERIAGELVAAVALSGSRKTAGVQSVAGSQYDKGTGAIEVRTLSVNVGGEIAHMYPAIQPGFYAALCALPLPCPPLRSPRECLESGLVRPLSGNRSRVPGLTWTPDAVERLGGFLATGPDGEASGAANGLHAFLPAVAAPDTAASAARPPEPADDETGKSVTILLVEDEPLVRELSRDMLERQGYRVILAADAPEAERIGARPVGFDLLITDAVMPGMTGPELAKRLRASRPDLKVLYIAGYAEPAIRHDDMAVAGSAQIDKPFSADALERKIRQMLDRG